MSKIKSVYRRIVHRLIVSYLIKCGGAFHHGQYGENGRYVKIFTDQSYDKFQKMLIEQNKTI